MPRGEQTRRLNDPAASRSSEEHYDVFRRNLAVLVVAVWCGLGVTAAAQRSASGVLPLELPKELRPLPEPLPQGKQPGFKLRGIKGWAWNPEQYLAEIPVLVEYKMNFLMNCYASLYGDELALGSELEPLVGTACPKTKKQGTGEGHPRRAEARLAVLLLDESATLLAAAPESAKRRRLRETLAALRLGPKPGREMVQSLPGRHPDHARPEDRREPTIASWSTSSSPGCGRRIATSSSSSARPSTAATETSPTHVGYLDTVARDLNPEIYLFWTGDTFTRITRAAAESYKKRVKHRLFLWDNYPVNDGQQTMHLGPVTARDADLCEVIDGYISNPMASQNEMNRIPAGHLRRLCLQPQGLRSDALDRPGDLARGRYRCTADSAAGSRRAVSRFHLLSGRHGHESAADRIPEADRRPQLLPGTKHVPPPGRHRHDVWIESFPIATRRRRRRRCARQIIEWMKETLRVID